MTETIFELLQRPFVQFLIFIPLTILTVFAFGSKNTESTWTVAGFVFIGFMVLNSVAIDFVPHQWRYFFYSLGISLLYLASIAIVIPLLQKIMKTEGSGESAMIFIFIIYHPVCLLVMMFLKWGYLKLF
jgi:hypothetical protein